MFGYVRLSATFCVGHQKLPTLRLRFLRIRRSFKKLPISSPFFVIKCVDPPCICKSLNSVRQSFRRPESTNESANERIRVGGDGVTTPKLTAAHSDERGFHFDKLASRFEMKINCQPRASCLNILINFYN